MQDCKQFVSHLLYLLDIRCTLHEEYVHTCNLLTEESPMTNHRIFVTSQVQLRVLGDLSPPLFSVRWCASVWIVLQRNYIQQTTLS